MFRAFRKFFSEYKQFGLAALSVIVALILYFLGYKTAANIILIISAILNVIPLIWGMIQDIRMGVYGVDILAATAIISAVLFKEYWAGMVIVIMLTGGEALEDYAEKRAQSELSALLDRVPQKAHVLRGRREIDVPVDEVQFGDKLFIRPGEVVPVDAVIIEGTSDVDESSLTGESLPVSKQIGEDVLSGSVTMDGALTVKALHTALDSQYSQIIKLVQSAQANRPPFVRLADRYSIPFTLLSFTIALAAWALSGQSIRFLEVLVVATPCPLILGAPIALISGMSRAAKHGIILKNGAALEQLAVARTIAFDKTGTLTEGKPVVKSVIIYGKIKRDTVLSLAAALEQSSNHILARAITEQANKKRLKIPKAKQVKEIPGRGLEAHVQGYDVIVGRLSLLKERRVSLPKQFKASSLSTTAALVAIDGVLAGAITFEDKLRPETKATLKRLAELKLRHLLMITGDNQTTAQQVAKQLGIKDVVAEALPVDKLQAVEAVEHKPTAFVGDGVNDAPVLAASDVGIALGARGSTAASESADVVIMTDDLGQVVRSIDISRRTLYIAKQSIFVGIGLSVALMLIFATGKFQPVYGAAIQEVVDVVVMINALRAHGSRRKPGNA
jgi:heavy metal translocating P-type ATPase